MAMTEYFKSLFKVYNFSDAIKPNITKTLNIIIN